MTELGKLLPESQGPTPGQASGTATPVNGVKVHEEGDTPLVDATIRFLKEFGPVEPKEKEKERRPNGYGKGKERREQEDEGEGDGLDSFMPTYVYDAMKEKKRFDNMRVGLSCLSFSVRFCVMT